MVNVFAIPVFFICFRESLEASIVISVLLAFLKQTFGGPNDANVRKRLVKQVWWGFAVGLIICACIGAGMIGAFYGLGTDHFAQTEAIWEGVFALVASIIISLVGGGLLRVSRMQEKWRLKLAKTLEAGATRRADGRSVFKRWAEKYAFFLVVFITILREGLEAVVFIGGVGVGMPASSFPLAVLTGLGAGCLIGYLVYRGGDATSLQIFLIASTCVLYLVAAGLFSKAVWYLEANEWNKIVGGEASELGSGAGSYDLRKSVWHVNCCNPDLNGGGGWGVFNSLLGWQNSATYGSVISYNVYWIAVIVAFATMRFKETRGHWPLRRASSVNSSDGSVPTQSVTSTTLAKGSSVEEGLSSSVREVS